jgi:hypothetical protein
VWLTGSLRSVGCVGKPTWDGGWPRWSSRRPSAIVLSMTTTRTFRIALLSGAAGALLALPATGSAAVTIGETLDPSAVTASVYCDTGDEPATFATTALPSGTPASPIDGVVVRWRFLNKQTAISLRPRVLKQALGGFTGAAGGDETAPFTGLGEFEARLPIAAGDYVGVDFPCSSSAPHPALTERWYPGGGASVGYWVPALADGGPLRATSYDDVNYSLMMNADVEPDADHDGYGDETQDGCPTKTGTHEQCPAVTPAPDTSAVPAAVPAADKTPPIASAAFKRSYKLRWALKRGIAGSVTSNEAGKVTGRATIGLRIARRLGLRRSVRVASGDASIASPGKVSLKLAFGRRARRKLAVATKVKLTLRLAATDSAGNATSIVRNITLKR